MVVTFEYEPTPKINSLLHSSHRDADDTKYESTSFHNKIQKAYDLLR